MPARQNFFSSVFRHPNKPVNYDLKIILDGHRIYPSKYVKYLGILIDPHLTWSYHVKSLTPKLTRAAGMLSIIRHYVPADTLNIYIFCNILINHELWSPDMGPA